MRRYMSQSIRDVRSGESREFKPAPTQQARRKVMRGKTPSARSIRSSLFCSRLC